MSSAWRNAVAAIAILTAAGGAALAAQGMRQAAPHTTPAVLRDARTIVEDALRIAADICVYTNTEINVEEL